MQSEAYLSDNESGFKAKDHKKAKFRKLKKNQNQDDEAMKENSDLDNEKSMSSSSSDSSSSISFSSDSSESGKAKRKNRNRKKTRTTSSDSSSDSSSSISISSSDLSFSESESEQSKAKEENLEEGEINEPEPRTSPISPSEGLNQLKKYKTEISRLKKKKRSIERNVKHLNKKLKQHPSSKKLKHKKKLEKKLTTYKAKINSYVSRQVNLLSKNPFLNDHLSPKRKQKSKKKSSKKREFKKSPPPSNQVKIPYPVLNDKREMTLIKEILEEKQQNLSSMLNKTRQTLDQNKAISNSQEEHDKLTRLKNLQETIRVQLQRLNKQLEYAKLNLEIHNLESRLSTEKNFDQINDINRRLPNLRKINEDLISQMKEANQNYLQNIENKEKDPKTLKNDAKIEASTVTVSGHPVSYRQTNIQMPSKIQNLNSMTPPSSSASSSSSSSSISQRPQQAFPRSQVKTPPLPNNQYVQNQHKFPRFAKINNKNDRLESSFSNKSDNSRYSASPPNQNNLNGFKRNLGNNYGNQMPNFENMFQNPQFIQSMMNVANDEVGNGLLPCPQKSGSMRTEDNQKHQMFSMFEQYFKKFSSGMGLGHMSQNQVYSLFETMQQNGNFSFANQMIFNSQMTNSNQYNSTRQSNNSRFKNNNNFNTNKQNNTKDFRFNKRNNSNLDNCQNKKQRF